MSRQQAKKQNISVKLQLKSMKNYEEFTKEKEIEFEPVSLKDHYINRKTMSQAELSKNLEIVSSKAYQDLINEINIMKIKGE